MRTLAAAALVTLLAAGCASVPPWAWPWLRPAELEKAERLAQRGEYAAAVAAYDAYLAKHGDDARARTSRDTLASILVLQREIARLREDLAKREADLERLKQLDLRLERGGEKK
jgi:hypothetical protein